MSMAVGLLLGNAWAADTAGQASGEVAPGGGQKVISTAIAGPADMSKRAEELRNLKWGMFICWSFSTFSEKEWTPGVKDVSFFKATEVDTDQWAKTAKEAGMGYILFLTKHHDGFCLWDTKTTDRKVTKVPLGKDVLAELNLCLPAEKLYKDYLGAVKHGNIFSIDIGPDYNGKLREIDVQTLRKVGEMIRSGGPQPAVAVPLRAFCVDFNWGPGGPNVFAKPGLWADADPARHVAWYEALGANVIQTFAVSCNGYAWYKGGKIPEQSGLAQPLETLTGNDRNIAVLAHHFNGKLLPKPEAARAGGISAQ